VTNYGVTIKQVFLHLMQLKHALLILFVISRKLLDKPLHSIIKELCQGNKWSCNGGYGRDTLSLKKMFDFHNF